MSTLKEKLMSVVTPPVSTGRNKVTVVGVGQVGMACAFSILTNVSQKISKTAQIIIFSLNTITWILARLERCCAD